MLYKYIINYLNYITSFFFLNRPCFNILFSAESNPIFYVHHYVLLGSIFGSSVSVSPEHMGSECLKKPSKSLGIQLPGYWGLGQKRYAGYDNIVIYLRYKGTWYKDNTF